MSITSKALATMIASLVLSIAAAWADEDSCDYLESAISGIDRSSSLAVDNVARMDMMQFVVTSDIQSEEDRYCVFKRAQLINANALTILQSFGPSVELIRRTFDECKSAVEAGADNQFSEELTQFVQMNDQSQAIDAMKQRFGQAQTDAIVAQGQLTPALLAFTDEYPSVLDPGRVVDCAGRFEKVQAQLERSVTEGYTVRRLGEFNYSDLSPNTGSACAALPEKIYKKIDSTHYPRISVSHYEFDRWIGTEHDYFAIEGGRLFWHKDKDHFFSLEGLHFYLETGFTMREALGFLRKNPIKDPNNPPTERQKKLMAAYHRYAAVTADASYESVGLDTPMLCGDGTEPPRYESWNARLHGLNAELSLGKDLRNVSQVFRR
ncbi:MAG: hypothetical protein AAFN07_09580 [Pseudomonadota bacterium]